MLGGELRKGTSTSVGVPFLLPVPASAVSGSLLPVLLLANINGVEVNFVTSRARLGVFVLVAFIIAWGSWLPALVWPSVPKALPLVGLFGPALAAIVVSGRAGRSEIVRRLRRWRFPAVWYFVAALVMPACYAVALRVRAALSGVDVRSFSLPHAPAFLAVSFLWLLLVTSGEEIGWRGYALPRLLDLGMSEWTASVAIGIVWGFWHLPLYLVPGPSPMPYALFLGLTVGQSFIYTSLYRRSGGSLLPALLLHATTDFGARLYRIDLFDRGTWLTIVVLLTGTGVALLAAVPHREQPAFHVPDARDNQLV